MCEERKIDVILLCEKQGIEKELQKEAQKYAYKVRTVRDDKNDILVLAREQCRVRMIDEYPHWSLCKIQEKDTEYLLWVVHLSSGLFKEELACNDALIELRFVIEQMEKVHLMKESKSVLVGDFNLQLYSHGVVSARGLNATMSKFIAKKEKRIINGIERKYFYNPMWNIMGADREVQGTYFNSSDRKEESLYWYTLDQVLVRPQMIDNCLNEKLEIVDRIKESSLLSLHKVNAEKYSDHLPIIFEID